jgi:RimJ/RimL family protein N-acetyltransferase
MGSRAAIGAALVSGTLAGVPGPVVRRKGSLMPDASFTELPGRRVLVRRFGPQDVAEFVAYRSDAEVARYQSWDAPYPPEQGERFVAQMMTAHPDTPGEWFQFAVALRATGGAGRRLCGYGARR